MKKIETIYISWHFTTHGMAYLKHILSAFYANKITNENLNAHDISQEEMSLVFENPRKGFVFDKIYYLTANQNTFDKLSSRRFAYKNELLNDKEIQKSQTFEIWKKIIESDFENLDEEINFVRKNYQAKFELWKNQIWRNVHHYTIEDQLIWWKKYSNTHANYKNSDFFEEVKTQVVDLRNQIEIAEKLKPIIDNIKAKHINAQFIINASLGSNETQVVWQIFSELNFLPTHSQLIRSYDNKTSSPNDRFKLFDIEQIPSKIISHIEEKLRLYEKQPETKQRKLADLKMQHYLFSGFAILILGERGIGKSRLAENHKSNKKFVSANCASFADDTMAESELFGHKKGAFTGADSNKKGLFETAKDGILFLDEIHHLSLRVQAKLMKAIETDENNNLTIRSLGDNSEIKIQTTLIFASNQKISELRKTLLPDFYDRISQQVIELPPLRETPSEIPNEFENTWLHMKFQASFPYQNYIEKDKKLIEWLKNQPLYGNYRDLQKIAIFYKNYLNFNSEIKKLLREKNAFDFTKNEFDKYISKEMQTSTLTSFFSDKQSVKEMESEFKKQLAHWAIDRFKGAPNAAKHFQKLGGKTTEETIYKWKNP